MRRFASPALAALLIFLTPFVTPMAPAQATDLQKNLPSLPPLKVGRQEFIARHNLFQTSIVMDQDGTIYLWTILKNHDRRLMRVSKPRAAKALLELKGWPYIVTKKGRLLAFDLHWRNTFYSKVPVLIERFFRRGPYALAAGGALYMGDLLLYGSPNAAQVSPAVHAFNMIATGFIIYTTYDVFRTLKARSPASLEVNGNYFTKEVAKNVIDVEYVQEADDYHITLGPVRRGDTNHEVMLSHIAPAFTNTTACIYRLVKLSIE